jgi:hypothetical protein
MLALFPNLLKVKKERMLYIVTSVTMRCIFWNIIFRKMLTEIYIFEHICTHFHTCTYMSVCRHSSHAYLCVSMHRCSNVGPMFREPWVQSTWEYSQINLVFVWFDINWCIKHNTEDSMFYQWYLLTWSILFASHWVSLLCYTYFLNNHLC